MMTKDNDMQIRMKKDNDKQNTHGDKEASTMKVDDKAKYDNRQA